MGLTQIWMWIWTMHHLHWLYMSMSGHLRIVLIWNCESNFSDPVWKILTCFSSHLTFVVLAQHFSEPCPYKRSIQLFSKCYLLYAWYKEPYFPLLHFCFGLDGFWMMALRLLLPFTSGQHVFIVCVPQPKYSSLTLKMSKCQWKHHEWGSYYLNICIFCHCP